MTPRAAALLPLLAACGGERALEGSLAEAFDLSFTGIELHQSPKAFQVSYLRADGREIVIRVTVVTVGIELEPGVAVDLPGEYEPGHPRATVVRAVAGEPLKTLPAVAQGSFTLDAVVAAGQRTGGSFFIRFGQGGDVGEGRTLNGKFTGKVIAVP